MPQQCIGTASESFDIPRQIYVTILQLTLQPIPTNRYYVEFLDECLRAHKDNILQENLFILLTSSEMVALCRVMAIVHFKICMPMRWLASNTHSIGSIGYDWSSRSMDKAIDALYDSMVEMEKDPSKFLDEDFMNTFFPRSTPTKMEMKGLLSRWWMP